jgi:hypothetical protein
MAAHLFDKRTGTQTFGASGGQGVGDTVGQGRRIARSTGHGARSVHLRPLRLFGVSLAWSRPQNPSQKRFRAVRS